jgi:hypothetical protein
MSCLIKHCLSPIPEGEVRNLLNDTKIDLASQTRAPKPIGTLSGYTVYLRKQPKITTCVVGGCIILAGIVFPVTTWIPSMVSNATLSVGSLTVRTLGSCLVPLVFGCGGIAVLADGIFGRSSEPKAHEAT